MSTAFVQQSSRRISRIFHPLILMNISAWIINIFVYGSPLLALINPLILFICLLPGAAYAISRKRVGQGTYNKGVFLGFALVGFSAAIAIYMLRETPPIIIKNTLIAFGVGLVIVVVNRSWDVSYHASIPMSCAALLLQFSAAIAVVLAVLGVIVGLARVPIKQHSWGQVVVGWLMGFGLTFGLMWAMGLV